MTTTGHIHATLDKLTLPIDQLKPRKGNPRRGDIDAIAESLERNGQFRPVVVNKPTGEILAGNHTYAAAKRLGWTHIAATFVDVDEDQAARIVLADNRTADLGDYDDTLLLDMLKDLDGDFLGTGYTQDDVDAILGDAPGQPEGQYYNDDPEGGEELEQDAYQHGSLSAKFGVPPFSVFDKRTGYWVNRKNEWKATGLDSGKGRDTGMLFPDRPDFLSTQLFAYNGGTSIFDPVVCEMAYRWFSAPGDHALDPFAGGVVRGFVAATLGRDYTGIDVRQEQIDTNRQQWQRLRTTAGPTGQGQPSWVHGDATRQEACLPAGERYDLVFSCPPYADLEAYSDQTDDISTWPYHEFNAAHTRAITDAVARLREDRYAVWVISDVRDKNGAYRGLVRETELAFITAGCTLLNDIVLLDPVGTTAMRAERPFRGTRKVARVHQHMLVFLKGDAKRAGERVEATSDTSFEGLLPADTDSDTDAGKT